MQVWVDYDGATTQISVFMAPLKMSKLAFEATGFSSLAALGGTGIRVVGGAPNYDLPALAHGGTASTAAWIQAYPMMLFRFVIVGNEVAGADTQLLVPAMENVHAALAVAGLGHIKVTTSISQATIGIHIPPSASEFTDEAKSSFLSYVIPFLEWTHAPLLANLYPYFIYSYNPGGMDISFALFTASERAAAGGGGVRARGGRRSGVERRRARSGWPQAGERAAG
uniref:Glucan endo-1,3-beta-D-glucosidase n=1 Tax=Oryza rufipogon TaxID=4529 RepID=A0A0E0P1V5_ORYRU